MKKSRIKGRIDKLLNIAEQSTFPHEAEAALLKAQELKTKYRVPMSTSAVEEELHLLHFEACFEAWLMRQHSLVLDDVLQRISKEGML